MVRHHSRTVTTPDGGAVTVSVTAKAGDHAEPEPQAAPPQPKGVGSLRTLKTMYNNWIAAGGTPPIYGPISPNGVTGKPF